MLSEEIVKSPDGMRLWQRERVKCDVSNRVAELMILQQVTEKQLAKAVGVKKKVIKKFLGSGKISIGKLSDIFTVLNREFHIEDDVLGNSLQVSTNFTAIAEIPDATAGTDYYQPAADANLIKEENASIDSES